MTLIKNKNIIGFAAYSGTGKTTLIKNIVSILKKRKYKVSVIKHAHHNFDIDHKGKDSYEIRKAGAENILISSKKRWALLHENVNNKELSLDELLNIIKNLNSDIILVEGFKYENFPKIELYRKIIGKNFLYTKDKNIIAIASNEPIKCKIDIDILDLNNPNQIVDYIINYFNIK